jgi:hypothetical protein
MPKEPDNTPPAQPAPDDEGGGGMMVFPGDQEAWDQDTTPEAKDHMLAAFMHAAGLGPHPGKKPHKIARGPRPAADDDEITDIDRQRAYEEPMAEAKEAGAKKMHAAQTGGASETGLGPTEAEQTLVKQRGALQQQSAAAGAQAAAQAQGQQASVAPPPAPVGPQGTTAPYSAQKGAVGGPGTLETPPAAPAGPQEPEPGPKATKKRELDRDGAGLPKSRAKPLDALALSPLTSRDAAQVQRRRDGRDQAPGRSCSRHPSCG